MSGAAPTGPEQTRPGRRRFGPVLPVGLAAGALAAVGATRPAAEATGVPAEVPLAVQPAVGLPLAGALSLVVLAAWGVALVTRRLVRRVVLVLGLVAALGTLAALGAGLATLPDDVRAPYEAAGSPDVGVSFTGWYVAAWVGATLTAAALAAAVRAAPRWPEMGSRYDAPARPATTRTAAGAAGSASAAPVGDAAGEDVDGARDLDLWKVIDEGRDPTAGPPQ